VLFFAAVTVAVDVIDSMATLTIDLSVFGPLLLGDESFCVDASVRISVVILSCLPYETIFISVLDFWRISIITSGSKVFGDYQHKEDNTTANQKSTHSIMAEFIYLYQVIIMNERHVTVRCPLHISRQD
jgi:hypothetical protein